MRRVNVGWWANRSDCETIICDFDLDDSLSGRLAVIVGPLLNARLSRAESRITKWGEDDSLDDAALVEKLYLHCFGRPPSRSESKYWVSVLGESVDRSRMLEDIAWSMLTSTQFTTNY